MPALGRQIVEVPSERGGHGTAPDRLIRWVIRGLMGQGLLGALSFGTSVLEHRLSRIPCCYRCPLWYDPRSFSHQTMLTEVGMKADIHPQYSEITARCSCGNEINTRSTLGEDISLDVCSQCHPFYTGKQKIVDTGGRVDRFNKRFGGRSLKK